MALTPKRQRFAEEYVTDCNGTQAAIRAGYSPRTAAQQGYRMLTGVDVQAEVARLQAAQAATALVTKAEAARAVVAIARDPTVPPAARLGAWTLYGRWYGYEAPTKVAPTAAAGLDLPKADWPRLLAARLARLADGLADRVALAPGAAVSPAPALAPATAREADR